MALVQLFTGMRPMSQLEPRIFYDWFWHFCFWFEHHYLTMMVMVWQAANSNGGDNSAAAE